VNVKENLPFGPRGTAAKLSAVQLLFCLFGLFFLQPCATTWAATADNAAEGPAVGVLFLPFTIEAPERYGYLEEGLAGMLSTRVANRAGVVTRIHTPEAYALSSILKEGKRERFRQALAALDAEYLAVGTLTAAGDKVTLTVYLYNRMKQQAPLTVSRSAAGMERILELVDEVAWDIAERGFGRKRPAPIIPATPDSAATAERFRTPHPERAFRKGLYQGSGLESGSGGDFLFVSGRRSKAIQESIRSMDVGDIDGDGRNEIVLAADTRLIIYRHLDERFQPVATVPLARYLRVHAVNIADINGNGIPEIYVSANNGKKPASWIVEHGGSGYGVIQGDIPYYLRPVPMQGQEMLLGQPGGVGEELATAVYRLQLVNGRVTTGPRIRVPGSTHIFDFVTADITGNGRREIITVDPENRIRVMDAAGALLWRSDRGYGAGRNYFGTMMSDLDDDRRKIYLPTRLLAMDLDGDNRAEIVIGKNQLAAFSYFERLRFFKGSSIAALTWRENTLAPLWETKKIANYTVDYQLVSARGAAKGGKAGEASFSLYFLEDLNSHPLNFLSPDSCRIHMYGIGKKQGK